MKSLTLALLFVVLVLSYASVCPAGYYHSDNIERPCYECWTGSYCPGDDKEYPCANGTVAPKKGMSQCNTCSSKRSESYRIFCLAEDTPAAAQEVRERIIDITSSNPYWYQVVPMSTFGGYAGDIAQYSFSDVRTYNPQVVSVYASSKSGKPSKSNNEWSAVSQNATIAIPSNGEMLRLIYFYLAPVAVPKATVSIGNFVYMVKEYPITQEATVINAGRDWALYPDIGALFRVKVPASAMIYIDISMEGLRFHDTDLSFTLYRSTVNAIEYPNMYNSDVVVGSSVGQVAKAEIRGNSQEAGEFIFQLITRTVWDARVIVNATIFGK